jgi:hypothetical protein
MMPVKVTNMHENDVLKRALGIILSVSLIMQIGSLTGMFYGEVVGELSWVEEHNRKIAEGVFEEPILHRG